MPEGSRSPARRRLAFRGHTAGCDLAAGVRPHRVQIDRSIAAADTHCN
jgi:hypothetical protein